MTYERYTMNFLSESSQRLLWLISGFLLLVLGAIFGTPGEYPILDGNRISPELVFQLLIPIVAGALVFINVIRTINNRVVSGSIQSGDLMAMLKLPEFWTGLVAIAAGVSEIFNIRILENKATQTLLADSLLGFITVLLNSYANTRLPAHTAQNVPVHTAQDVPKRPLPGM